MEIIIGVRFSLWKEEFARVSKEEFYSKERLDEKFFLFEKITYPSIELQTDQNFKFVLYLDEHLPLPYRKSLGRFNRAILLNIEKYENVGENKYLKPILEPETKQVAFVRLDDDDGLHYEFIESLRKSINEHITLGSFVIDFPHGLEAHVKKSFNDAIIYSLTPICYNYAAQGLTSLSGIDEKNSYAYRHGKIDKNFKVVSNSYLNPAYIRTLMNYNHTLLYRPKIKRLENVSILINKNTLGSIFGGS